MCYFTVGKKYNLPLVFPLFSSYYQDRVVAVQAVWSLTTHILLSLEEQLGEVPLHLYLLLSAESIHFLLRQELYILEVLAPVRSHSSFAKSLSQE